MSSRRVHLFIIVWSMILDDSRILSPLIVYSSVLAKLSEMIYFLVFLPPWLVNSGISRSIVFGQIFTTIASRSGSTFLSSLGSVSCLLLIDHVSLSRWWAVMHRLSLTCTCSSSVQVSIFCSMVCFPTGFCSRAYWVSSSLVRLSSFPIANFSQYSANDCV
jgi:hypothetical protein